ncbi:MAG: hypothetical protein HC908_13795 [Calothrix sp. SM1_7_51]|nr:hypothetical protein [Calothrix sp. SM1_7_51]
MTLAWSSSLDENLFESQYIPEKIKLKLSEVYKQHYEELYESNVEVTISLQEALESILQLFKCNHEIFEHIRYVWMALIIALGVKPTVEYYQPTNPIPKEVIKQMSQWLRETIKLAISSETTSVNNIHRKKIDNLSSISIINIETDKLPAFQVLHEALDVYSNAIKTLDYTEASKALLDILDDCLEGYAIFLVLMEDASYLIGGCKMS